MPSYWPLRQKIERVVADSVRLSDGVYYWRPARENITDLQELGILESRKKVDRKEYDGTNGYRVFAYCVNFENAESCLDWMYEQENLLGRTGKRGPDINLVNIKAAIKN